jgi:hypothetical protein
MSGAGSPAAEARGLTRPGPVFRALLRRPLVLAALIVVFGVGAILAAYLDWIWWEPYRSITITIGAVATLLVAGLLVIVPATRTLALFIAVFGFGIVAGQVFGPARPELIHSEGQVTVTLTSPRATTGTGVATCATSSAGTELQVGGDSNLRLDIFPDDPAAPADVDQREFVSFSITAGDRWSPGPEPRSDDVHLSFIVGRVEAESLENRMAAGAGSPLELQWSNDGGTLTFSGLVPDIRATDPAGDHVDLAGTMEWTCGGGAVPSSGQSDSVERQSVSFPVVEPIEDLAEDGLLGDGSLEERHRRANLHGVDLAEDLDRRPVRREEEAGALP